VNTCDVGFREEGEDAVGEVRLEWKEGLDWKGKISDFADIGNSSFSFSLSLLKNHS